MQRLSQTMRLMVPAGDLHTPRLWWRPAPGRLLLVSARDALAALPGGRGLRPLQRIFPGAVHATAPTRVIRKASVVNSVPATPNPHTSSTVHSTYHTIPHNSTQPVLQQAVPEEPAWRGHSAGRGQRLLGVPTLPWLLRHRLRHLLQLRPLPQGGEPGVPRPYAGISLLVSRGVLRERSKGGAAPRAAPRPCPSPRPGRHNSAGTRRPPLLQSGLAPTHQIINLARAAGFENVHDYLVRDPRCCAPPAHPTPPHPRQVAL